MIADWSVPFDLRSVPYTGDPNDLLLFNTPITDLGLYLLDPAGCSLDNTVRANKENVPQADGAILHTRFLAGMEMKLAIQLWNTPDKIACNEQLQTMLDTLMGYLYGLLNADDNEGRITWDPTDMDDRMLDDLRLWTYPVVTQPPGAALTVTTTLDCPLPYEESEEQTQTSLPDSATTTVPNAGNRPTYPTWRIYGPYTGFTLATVAGTYFEYDDSQPGAPTIGGGDYIEINTFKNTAYVNGDGANATPGITMTTSDFFLIPNGGVDVILTYIGGAGGASIALTNDAWA